MRSALKHYIVAASLALPFLLLTANSAAAQSRSGRGGGGGGGGNDGGSVSVEFTAEISFSVGDRDQIQAYYSSNPNPAVEALPPGH